MPKPRQTALINASAALTLYGSWAFYANYDHGATAAWLAGFIQGSYAFVSTLTVTLLALKIYHHYKGGIKGVTLGFSASFVAMLVIPWAVHTAAGTPDTLQTVLPGLIWGSIYLVAVLYLQLKKTPR